MPFTNPLNRDLEQRMRRAFSRRQADDGEMPPIAQQSDPYQNPGAANDLGEAVHDLDQAVGHDEEDARAHEALSPDTLRDEVMALHRKCNHLLSELHRRKLSDQKFEDPEEIEHWFVVTEDIAGRLGQALTEMKAKLQAWRAAYNNRVQMTGPGSDQL
jgi:hypothetical protein